MTTTGSKWLHGWLVGADGLHSSEDASDWQLVGGTGHPVHDLIRRPEDLFCATMFGLWQVRDSRQADSPQADEPSPWLQLHDETLTEILGIAPDEGDPGVVAVSPYGLAFGAQVDGVHRWQSRCDGLTLNERFSSAVLPHPLAPGHWIVATEDGVRIYSDSDGQTQGQWEGTDLTGLPCRALLYAHDRLWAATDGGGIWRSDDGSSWRRAGTGTDEESVFALGATADGILAGTLRGICFGDGESRWQRSGPSLLVSAVAAHCDDDRIWLAGATPGGLWRSEDAGATWGQTGNFDSVRVILPPISGHGKVGHD